LRRLAPIRCSSQTFHQELRQIRPSGQVPLLSSLLHPLDRFRPILLDASAECIALQALSLELALGATFQEFNAARLEMDDEEDAEMDAATVTELQAEEENEGFKQLLAV
jgi:hypothetical protein